MRQPDADALWDGEKGAGGISWLDRSRMGLLRGVIDAADDTGRRNLYMHTLHTAVLKNELRRASPIRRALDFGCGTGRFLKTLSEHCAQVYALDKEPCMIEAARTYAGKYAKEIACWRAGEINFGGEPFDFVLCSSVLCVTTTLLFDLSLVEMGSICRPGGTLLLLEQVAPERGLSLLRYGEALDAAGFEVLRAYPIRPATSAMTSLITRQRWIPKACFEPLAMMELARVARHGSPKRCPYVEYAIVARRR